jgi:Cd2+/Zn2+-exporting ATPase
VRRAADSAAARLVRLIEDAQAQRSPTELIVDRFAKIYTPLVVLAALLLVRPPSP